MLSTIRRGGLVDKMVALVALVAPVAPVAPVATGLLVAAARWSGVRLP